MKADEQGKPIDWTEQWFFLTQSDEHALSALFHAFHGPLYQYGFRISRDEEFTRDCLQNIFFRLWQHRKSLKPVQSVKAYLYQSLRHEILRKKEVLRKQQEKQLDFMRTEPDLVFSTEEVTTQAESFYMRSEVLRDALNGLSKREKEVVYLRFYSNLEYDEIAPIMSISYQSVLNLLQQAFRKLRSNHLIKRVVELGFFLLAGLSC